MIEVSNELNGATIQRIEQRTGDDIALEFRGEYSAYDIRIVTDRGVIVIAGAHDTGGDVLVLDRERYENYS